MKKVIYLHQYFKLPSEPGGTRSYWIAQELIKQGYEVTMVTSSGDVEEKVRVVEHDGISVIYFREEYDQNMSVLRRLKAFVNFMYKSSLYLFKQKDVDLVFATSTPLTIGIPALLLKWFKQVPYVFEVRDLWPEVPIQMGALRNPLIKWMARWLEKTIYRNAEHVIALSPGMQDGVVKYIPAEKTSMIPNMSKVDEFWPREKNKELVQRLGLRPDSFKIIHFGSLGLANGAETIIESAKLLKEDNSVEFLFVGGGSTEKDLAQECQQHQLTNVKFLGRFPMKDTSEIVNLSDVSLVSFKDLPILYTNSPNKLFDSLSAGKPIIVNSAGWTKDMVEEYNCGYYVDSKIPEQLVIRIRELQNNPQLLKQMGENSRRLAEMEYDKNILTKKVVAVLNTIPK